LQREARKNDDATILLERKKMKLLQKFVYLYLYMQFPLFENP
jgi:hypothetical protein